MHHAKRVSSRSDASQSTARRIFEQIVGTRGRGFPAFVLSLAAALGLAAGQAGADPGDRLPGAEIGSRVYSEHCSACHGADGRGGTPLGKLFRVAPPDLTRIASRRGGWFPEALVRELIDGRIAGHGERQMPVWGRVLTQQEMIAITEHLFAIQKPPLVSDD